MTALLKLAVSGGVALGVLAGPLFSTAAIASSLQPHLAVYDLKLKDASERSGIKGLRGRMVLEVLGGSCEGWSVNFRMVNQFILGEGQSRTIDSRSTSWESDDGLSYHYAQSQHIDGNKSQEIRLKVKRPAISQPATGKQTKASAQEFELEAGTLFPVLHQQHLVDLALSGKSHDNSKVFDGSEGPATSEVVAFVGPAIGDKKQTGEGAEALKDMRSWPVVTSYFPVNDNTVKDTPDYKVSFRLFENGIAGDMVLDYGEFQLEAALARVSSMEKPVCN